MLLELDDRIAGLQERVPDFLRVNALQKLLLGCLRIIDFDGNLVLHQPIHVALIELLVQRSLTLVVDELEVGLRCVHL